MTCDTVGIMSKAMSLRLPDDVAKALEQAAKEQERSQAQVIVRALRVALDADQNKNWNIPAWASEFVSSQIKSIPQSDLVIATPGSTRLVKGPTQSFSSHGVLGLKAKVGHTTLRTPEEAAEVDKAYSASHVPGRYRKCPHGANEYTCERTRCKINTGRA